MIAPPGCAWPNFCAVELSAPQQLALAPSLARVAQDVDEVLTRPGVRGSACGHDQRRTTGSIALPLRMSLKSTSMVSFRTLDVYQLNHWAAVPRHLAEAADCEVECEVGAMADEPTAPAVWLVGLRPCTRWRGSPPACAESRVSRCRGSAGRRPGRSAGCLGADSALAGQTPARGQQEARTAQRRSMAPIDVGLPISAPSPASRRRRSSS